MDQEKSKYCSGSEYGLGCSRVNMGRAPRHAMVAVETLLIFGSFSLAAFLFFFLGKAVISAFFGDGNHYTAIPLF